MSSLAEWGGSKESKNAHPEVRTDENYFSVMDNLKAGCEDALRASRQSGGVDQHHHRHRVDVPHFGRPYLNKDKLTLKI